MRGPCDVTLEIVSLNDHTEAYARFLWSAEGEGKTARRILHEWKRLRCPGSAHAEALRQGDVHVPSADAYRFNWGDFAALSYVWGSEKDKREVVVNGATVRVTKNLEEILRRLATGDEFAARYRIWIDALCINQGDEAEQASQVRKMREIYSGAWAVVAWLGEGREGTPIPGAFAFLRTLASLTNDERDLSSQALGGREGLVYEVYFYKLHEMMKNEYWTRLWIVQEVVMGASSTVLRCGDHVIDWNTFCAGIAVLYYGNNWDFKDRMLLRARSCGFTTDLIWQTVSIHLVHKDLRQMGQYEDEGGERLGFRRLLEVANSMHCRDLRDKVFALIGMMEPEIANEVIQAYSLDIPRLFSAVTKAFVKYYNNLEPLRQANPWGGQGAPSWAADWTWEGRMRWSRPETNPTGPLWDFSDPEPKPDTIYNAHGGIPAEYSFPDDHRLLRCEGFIFDEIGGLGASQQGSFHWDTESIVQSPTWRSAYGDEHATSTALYRALMGDRISKGERVAECHSALLSLPSNFNVAYPQFLQRGWTWLANRRGYYFKWKRWRGAHNGFMLGDRPMESYFTDTIPEDAEEAVYMEVFRSVERTVMERRFILTKSGYFGWVTDDAFREKRKNQAMVGDLIAIVFGCSTPLVIRRHGSSFQVVGEAFVQGFMDGEAIHLLGVGEYEQQLFTFC